MAVSPTTATPTRKFVSGPSGVAFVPAYGVPTAGRRYETAGAPASITPGIASAVSGRSPPRAIDSVFALLSLGGASTSEPGADEVSKSGRDGATAFGFGGTTTGVDGGTGRPGTKSRPA